MQASITPINGIFNGTRVLEIPFFQRSYVWDDNQWERLLEDMVSVCHANKPYFLGSVILKQQLTCTGAQVGDRRIVIDGQQRLTSLNIFFKVLCLKTDQNSNFERIFRLISNNEIALLHNHNDISAFNTIVDLTEIKDIAGENRITRAYNYFKNNLDPSNLNFNTILSNIFFVDIDLTENEDERQIFDTINSLGIRLTTAELLKNHFFNRDEISTYNTYWKNVFEKDEETKKYWDKEITAGRHKRTFIDLFFFSYLQIKIQEKSLNVRTEDKIEFSKVEQLFESYKKFIKDYLNNNKSSVLYEIKEYALLFQKNFDPDVIEKELSDSSGIERINTIIFGLDTSTLIPYVLYVLKNVSTDNNRNDLFEFIESYIMRRLVVRATNKNYNQLFTDRLINNEILSKKQFIEYLDGQDDKVNFLPSDADLKFGFDNMSLNNKHSKGILYFIESKIRNKTMHSTRLLGIKKYSVEHLMPNNWENQWSTLSNQEDINKRNRKLLTLGNLTIITQSLNSKLKDANWKDKRFGKAGNSGLNAYSADLETMNYYLTLDEWNEQTIEDRAKFLYDNAKEIWKTE
jgi:uncharacterized protein with ParB-like and HNH nuclease domain